MSPSLQTIVAVGIVALVVLLFVRSSGQRRKNPGCGSEGCGAISPEVKKLQARLRR